MAWNKACQPCHLCHNHLVLVTNCTALALTFAPPALHSAGLPLCIRGEGVTPSGYVFLQFYLPRVTPKGNIVQGKNNPYSGVALFLFERIDRIDSRDLSAVGEVNQSPGQSAEGSLCFNAWDTAEVIYPAS